jgi:hypothetical protein
MGFSEHQHIEEYRRLLCNGSQRQKAVAIIALGNLGLAARPALPDLLSVISEVNCDDKSLDSVAAAIPSFGASSIASYIKAASSSGDRDDSKTRAAWEVLMRLASAKNPAVAHNALSRIGLLGECAIDALPVLHQIASGEGDDEIITIRARAFEAILRIAPIATDDPMLHAARQEYAKACKRWASEYLSQGNSLKANELLSLYTLLIQPP